MMNNRISKFLGIAIAVLTIGMSRPSSAQTVATIQPSDIYASMKKTADWQWQDLAKNGWKTPKTDWTNGAMYAGMMAWGKVANDDTYFKKLIEVGDQNKWDLGAERFFADDYCVGQTYSQLYNIYKDPKYIAKFVKLADTIVTLPHSESLLWVNEIYNREWAWCDALFMGPPALGYLTQATGNAKYLNTASKLWWKSSAWLYDKDEHLFYRDSRYFDKKEANGAKVFWSRGNGWVMGGLVRILEVMPKNHPDRKNFEKQFKEMAKKVASLQQADGSWHASLLDPASFPVKETSGTGFFAYALAWGINHGLIDYNSYKDVVRKSWSALTSSVHPNGKLGFVQAQGRDPQSVTYEDTDVYGVGAFLLAGTEMLKMELNRTPGMHVMVTNPTAMKRTAQTIELTWKEVSKKVKNLNAQNIVVFDVMTGKQIASQVLYDGKKSPQSIIFQTDISEGTTLNFIVTTGTRETYTQKTFGRQVPERYDDFAWENDRVIFRMYGAALDARPDNAKGIDYWAKNTSDLVIDKRYKLNEYHIDHGDGMDGYHVGFTLGAGNSSPLVDTTFIFPNNYSKYEIVEQGPIRLTFKLFYKPWQVNGKSVSEVKTISLDAGSSLNKILDEYKFEGTSLNVATGITKHKNDGNTKIDNINHLLSYWDQADGKVDNGKIGIGVVYPANQNIKLSNKLNHLLGIIELKKNEVLTYYQGGAWNRGGHFSNENEWIKYLENFSKNLAQPLIVTYQ